MEYILKTNAIITLFYVCYVLFLQRETFFTANRFFLIAGLFTAILFPMFTIPVYVEAVQSTQLMMAVTETTTFENSTEPFDISVLLIWTYVIGVSFFLGKLTVQLISLAFMLKRNNKNAVDGYLHIKTDHDTTPFSFFKWIVYNPKQFNADELQLILEHEKVHAQQIHSIDVLLIHLATALFWFNPIIWLYRKALKQNLEFIADRDTLKQTSYQKLYQKLLVKTCVQKNNNILINTFYNSTIKQRIVMLHKSKSHFTNYLKYGIVIPLLVIFAMNFNTKIIAQTSVKTTNSIIDDQQNILKFVVTKDTKDSQLDFIKSKLADNGATISFDNLKRNSKDEITNIKIQFKYKNSTGNHATKSSEPIQPIEISMNPSDDALNVGQQISGLSQTFDVDTTDNGQKVIVVTSSTTSSTTTASSDKNSDQNAKDSIFIETTVDTITWTTGKNKNFRAIETDINKINGNNLINNPEKAPLIFLNGNKINPEEMNDIAPNTIKSITILKDEEATKKYGDTNGNGVLLILSNDPSYVKSKSGQLTSLSKNQNKKTNNISIATTKSDSNPLYILDGKEITAEELHAINTNSIESINVLKDKKATEKYGEKGNNGVIIVNLKKE